MSQPEPETRTLPCLTKPESRLSYRDFSHAGGTLAGLRVTVKHAGSRRRLHLLFNLTRKFTGNLKLKSLQLKVSCSVGVVKSVLLVLVRPQAVTCSAAVEHASFCSHGARASLPRRTLHLGARLGVPYRDRTVVLQSLLHRDRQPGQRGFETRGEAMCFLYLMLERVYWGTVTPQASDLEPAGPPAIRVYLRYLLLPIRGTRDLCPRLTSNYPPVVPRPI